MNIVSKRMWACSMRPSPGYVDGKMGHTWHAVLDTAQSPYKARCSITPDLSSVLVEKVPDGERVCMRCKDYIGRDAL